MTPLIESFLRMKSFGARGPRHWLSYSRWRSRGLWNRVFRPPMECDDGEFLGSFNLDRIAPSRPDPGVLLDESRLSRDLASYFSNRTTPRFFFSKSDVAPIVALISTQEKDLCIRAAERVNRHVFHFRSVEPPNFDGGIDWTCCPQGNIEWTWDLNRHGYFETLGRAYHYTGDGKYALACRSLLLDWLAANPVSPGYVNWCSILEVAFRINSWIWAFHYFHSSSVFDDRTILAFLKGLLTHGRYLRANLEFHVPNNHLLLEAKSLAMLGTLFPEFREAAEWRKLGLKILYRQVRGQVCSDGVHAERSTHYHRLVAAELLEFLVLMQNNEIPVPADIRERFHRMVEFELWFTKPDGLISLFGDSAWQDTALRFSAIHAVALFPELADLRPIAPPPDEAALWLLGSAAIGSKENPPDQKVSAGSRAFPEGGYFIMRAGEAERAAYLAFDCGPFGFGPLPSHGHADALSFELHSLGRTFLVDPGGYSSRKQEKEWRDFFRGSSAHNTIVVDQQDQSFLFGIRGVDRPAEAILHDWVTTEHCDFVDGAHSGYERLAEPINHRRQIFFVKPDYWIVIDLLAGRGRHCFDLFFHLAPGFEVGLETESKTLYSKNGDEPGITIAPLLTGDLEAELITGARNPFQGWISFIWCDKKTAPALRLRRQETAPLQFCTLLYPHPAGGDVPARVSPLQLEVEGRQDDLTFTAVRIQTDTFVDHLIVDRGPAGTRKRFGAYETDAQVLYLRQDRDRENPTRVMARGGTELLFRGRPLLEIQSCEPFTVM